MIDKNDKMNSEDNLLLQLKSRVYSGPGDEGLWKGRVIFFGRIYQSALQGLIFDAGPECKYEG
jgi:hypothetical protein